jgi:hypothetical protein
VYSYDVFVLDTMSCPVEFLDTVGHVSLGGHIVCLCEYGLVGQFHTCERLGSLTLTHLTSSQEQKCGMSPC